MSEFKFDDDAYRRLLTEAKREVAERESREQRTAPSPRRSGSSIKPVEILRGFLSERKNLIMLGTMALAIALQSAFFGCPMALGITGMVLVHELGHVYACRMLKLSYEGMVFLPFIGAFVMHQETRNASDEAFLALLGPVFGGAYGIVALALFLVFRNDLWMSVAWFSFFWNLINLLPIYPLDGSHIVPLFRKKSRRNVPSAYFRTPPKDRKTYGIATGLLVAVLIAGMAVLRVLPAN